MGNLENLKFYKSIFEKLSVAIFIADINTGYIVDANQEACDLIDLPYDELTKLHQSQLHPPFEDQAIIDRFKNHVQELLDNKKVEPAEHVVCDSKGNHIPVEITPTLVHLDEKTYIIGLFKDLRERKEHENVISYYDKAMEKSSTFLAFVDENYIYKSANEAYAKNFNKTKKEVIGQTIANVVGDEYFYSTVKDNFDKALKGESVHFESKLELNGKTKYLEANYEPYYNIEKQIVGVVVTVHDMTRYKEYEIENIRKEKLLVQQSKMAAMGEMLENIAHQWRQPLSVISTCASGINLQKDFGTLTDEMLLESLKNIVNTTSYLSETINDFKNFFERDKDKIDFNINQNIDKTLDLIEIGFANNEIAVLKDYKDSITIHSYNNEFMQVLLNILNNAKDAIISNEKLQGKRKIICITVYKKDDNAIIEIKDNAGGINDEVIDKIFEPYFTTKHQSQGTGIGLFMTREIVTKHMEGSIEVENTRYELENIEYEGALFRIII